MSTRIGTLIILTLAGAWERLERYLGRSWFLIVGELGFFIDGWDDAVIERAVKYETFTEFMESL